jgi:hypothetical protein
MPAAKSQNPVISKKDDGNQNYIRGQTSFESRTASKNTETADNMNRVKESLRAHLNVNNNLKTRPFKLKVWTHSLGSFFRSIYPYVCIGFHFHRSQFAEGIDIIEPNSNPSTSTPTSPLIGPLTQDCNRNSSRQTSCSSIKSADIRYLRGRWMVSEDLEKEEPVFIQFPPLIEAESGERIAAKDFGMIARDEKGFGRSQVRGDDDSTLGRRSPILTPPENDTHKEWYPL